MPQIDATPEAQTGTPETTTEAPVVSREIMDRLGIPEELRKEIGLEEKPPAEVEKAAEETDGTPPETEAPDKPEAGEEEPAEQQPDSEPEQETARAEETLKDWPEPIKKEFLSRVGKLTRQKTKERERAEAAEAERDDLKAKLDGAEPVVVQPSVNDPLAGVQTATDLNHIKGQARATVKWCRENRDGTVFTDPKGVEHSYTSEQVAQIQNHADDILDALPEKAKSLERRAQSEQVARAEYPRLFEKGTAEYQAAQAILQEIPGLATHPARSLVVGDFLVGMGIRLNRPAQSQNGNGATNGHKTADAADPLQRKIPPVAQHVARSASGSAPSPNGKKKLDEAMNNVLTEGGSLESLTSAIGAMRRSNAASPSGRSAAPV